MASNFEKINKKSKYAGKRIDSKRTRKERDVEIKNRRKGKDFISGKTAAEQVKDKDDEEFE